MKSIKQNMENFLFWNMKNRMEIDIERLIRPPIKRNVSLDLRSQIEAKIDIDSIWNQLSDQLSKRRKYKI
jgi:hypothetical protein